ncbi:MAG TPA: hypothetical protein VND22_02515 [Actinomycetota bacterium]|nr:hypothetical protein [Actinomycetota bacterium]
MQTLQEFSVDFVVIGGFAGRIHGSPLNTNDLDICYSREAGNLERLASALNEMDARLRGAPEDLPFRIEAETLRAGDHFTLLTRFGAFDVLGTPAGTTGFDQLKTTAQEVDLDGLEVFVASLDDLIKMKLEAGRPQDMYQAEVLGALRDEIDNS